MVGPLVNTFLYTYQGPRAVWILEMASVSVVLGSWGVFYNRMVDLKIPLPEPPAQVDSFGYQNPQYETDDEDEI